MDWTDFIQNATECTILRPSEKFSFIYGFIILYLKFWLHRFYIQNAAECTILRPGKKNSNPSPLPILVSRGLACMVDIFFSSVGRAMAYSAIGPGIQSCRTHVSEIEYALQLHIKKNQCDMASREKTFKNVFRIHKFQIVQSKRRFYRMWRSDWMFLSDVTFWLDVFSSKSTKLVLDSSINMCTCYLAKIIAIIDTFSLWLFY